MELNQHPCSIYGETSTFGDPYELGEKFIFYVNRAEIKHWKKNKKIEK